MIRHSVIKYGMVGFICQSLDHFKKLIDDAKEEEITFSKIGFIENYDSLFEKYTKFVKKDDGGAIALICLASRMLESGESKNEFQFFSRSITDYQRFLRNDGSDYYHDWEKFTMINYSEVIRDNKLKEILNG